LKYFNSTTQGSIGKW